MTNQKDRVDTRFYLLCSHDEFCDLASGFVPSTVRAKALYALDEEANDQRRADRPMKTRVKTSS